MSNVLFSETLRKYPPGIVLSRVSNKDYKVPDTDVVLPKGSEVLIPVLGLHKDPEYFPNPEKFDPDRFSLENKKTRPSCTYLPFGEGPRNCIGKQREEKWVDKLINTTSSRSAFRSHAN